MMCHSEDGFVTNGYPGKTDHDDLILFYLNLAKKMDLGYYWTSPDVTKHFPRTAMQYLILLAKQLLKLTCKHW